MAFKSLVRSVFDARNKKQDIKLTKGEKVKTSIPDFINRRRNEREQAMQDILDADK